MAENDNIASNLNNLFGSNLFKENNFIKIYNLLGIGNIESPEPAPPEPASPPAPAAPAPAAPAPAPAAPAAASTEIDKILGKFNYNNNNNKLFYDNTTEIKIFDDSKKFDDSKNLAEIIKEFIEKLAVTDFNVNKDAFKAKILDSIKIGDIVNELGDNDIIVDPAGLNFMQTNFNGAKGLSASIYLLLDPIYNTSSPDDVQKYFKNFTDENDLFKIDKKNKNAFHHYYNYNDKKIHLIHAIGPNYRGESLTHIKDEYKNFMILYNDIYNEYNNIKTITDKNLRLPLHSTGQFSGGDSNMNYILICLALAYLYIYCTINEGNKGNKDEVKIYYLFNDNIIEKFKKILEYIINLIKE